MRHRDWHTRNLPFQPGKIEFRFFVTSTLYETSLKTVQIRLRINLGQWLAPGIKLIKGSTTADNHYIHPDVKSINTLKEEPSNCFASNRIDQRIRFRPNLHQRPIRPPYWKSTTSTKPLKPIKRLCDLLIKAISLMWTSTVWSRLYEKPLPFRLDVRCNFVHRNTANPWFNTRSNKTPLTMSSFWSKSNHQQTKPGSLHPTNYRILVVPILDSRKRLNTVTRFRPNTLPINTRLF